MCSEVHMSIAHLWDRTKNIIFFHHSCTIFAAQPFLSRSQFSIWSVLEHMFCNATMKLCTRSNVFSWHCVRDEIVSNMHIAHNDNDDLTMNKDGKQRNERERKKSRADRKLCRYVVITRLTMMNLIN